MEINKETLNAIKLYTAQTTSCALILLKHSGIIFAEISCRASVFFLFSMYVFGP